MSDLVSKMDVVQRADYKLRAALRWSFLSAINEETAAKDLARSAEHAAEEIERLRTELAGAQAALYEAGDAVKVFMADKPSYPKSVQDLGAYTLRVVAVALSDSGGAPAAAFFRAAMRLGAARAADPHANHDAELEYASEKFEEAYRALKVPR